MIYSRNYSRLFITLKQERSDFCYDMRPAMGRCIIEIRKNNGKIMIFAQGLKPRVLYRVILVKEENDACVGVNAGLINIDEKGKGDFSINFEPDNVLSSGLKIEDIGAVLIIVDGIGELAAPLVGFRDKGFVWKNNFKILRDNEITKKDDEIFDKKEIIEADTSINKDIESEAIKNNAVKEQEKENRIEENHIKEGQNENKESLKELEAKKNQQAKQGARFPDFNAFLEKFRHDMLELEHYASMTEADKPIKRGRGIQGLDYIKKNNTKIKPFEKNDEAIVWFKIMPCELTSVNAKLWRHMNSPFINACFRKYRHLLLGIKNIDENESYVIGVPEAYDEMFLAEAKKHGFTSFVPRDDKELKAGDFGYWILEVD